MASKRTQKGRRKASHVLSIRDKSVPLRDELDVARESGKWSDALEICKRTSRYTKDNGILQVIKGQQACSNQEIALARSEWQAIIQNPNSRFVQEARALLAILEVREGNQDEGLKLLKAVHDYVRNLKSDKFQEELFGSSYRMGILTKGLSEKANIELSQKKPARAHKTLKLIYDFSCSFFQTFPTITPSDEAWRVFEDSLLQLSQLTYVEGNTQEAISTLRNALNVPVPLSKPHSLKVLHNLTNLFLYDCACDSSQYPRLSNLRASQRFELNIDRPYIPVNALEEGLLTGLLLEDACNAPELHALFTTSIYDDIVFGFATQDAFQFSIEALEQGVVKRSDNNHLWTQLALNLVAAGKLNHAYAVVKQILEVQPTNPVILLLGVQICISKLDYEESVLLGQRCVECCSNDPSAKQYLPRAYHYLALSYSALAPTILSIKQNLVHQTALETFQAAYQAGCRDYLFFYHWALEYAEIRNIQKATCHVQHSLQLNPSHCPSWILFILLLSSQKLYQQAEQICELALEHHPRNILLLHCTVQVLLALKKRNDALSLLKACCMIINSQNDAEDDAPTSSEEIIRLTTPRVTRVDDSDRSYSQMSDSQSSNIPPKIPLPKLIPEFGLLEVWTTLAEIFIELKQFTDAEECLQEAFVLNPYSADMFFQRAQLAKARGDLPDATQTYKEALTCDSHHLQSMIQLAILHMDTNLDISESYLSTAVRRHPYSFVAWSLLGDVQKRRENFESASACYSVALDLEETTPLLPFSVLKRELLMN